jgi:hypothetical protein
MRSLTQVPVPLLRNLICVELVKRFCVLVVLTAFIPAWANAATAPGVSALNLLSGSDSTLLSPQKSDVDTYRSAVEMTNAPDLATCPPWCQCIPFLPENKKAALGVDLQALSVLNQSPGGQNSYLSSDVSVNVLLRNWNLRERDFSLCDQPIVITLMHEPALGITRSMHFRDPGDATGTPAQTPNLTIHPLLNAQSDLFNLTINHKKSADEPLVEFKLTVAPQLDLYGRFTGKDAQVQLPLQPSIELHFTKQGSLVVQAFL